MGETSEIAGQIASRDELVQVKFAVMMFNDMVAMILAVTVLSLYRCYHTFPDMVWEQVVQSCRGNR